MLFLALEVAQPLRNTLVIFFKLIRDISDDTLLNGFYSTSFCDNIFETYAIFYPLRSYLAFFFVLRDSYTENKTLVKPAAYITKMQAKSTCQTS